jgi:hypothetical protein
MQILMPDGSRRPWMDYMAKPEAQWSSEDWKDHRQYEEEVKRMLNSKSDPPLDGYPRSSQRNPEVIPAGMELKRQCGVIENHGAYATKCWKAQGHDGPHQGSFIDLQELPPGEIPEEIGKDVALRPQEPSDSQPETQGTELALRSDNRALAAIAGEMRSISERFERFESNVHQLNLVARELVRSGLTPLKNELAQLRYNLGDKANGVMSTMESLMNHLDKQLGIALQLRGATLKQAEGYRETAGISVENAVTSSQEMEPKFDEVGNQVGGFVKANDTGAPFTSTQITKARLEGSRLEFVRPELSIVTSIDSARKPAESGETPPGAA